MLSIFDDKFYSAVRDGAEEPEYEGFIAPEQWFRVAVALELNEIAEQMGCHCDVSYSELEMCRYLWVRDTDRMEIDGDGTPNHFKQAGFIAYWLRRRMVVRRPSISKIFTGDDENRQTAFMQMAAEYGSFILGYNLCLFAGSLGRSNRTKYVASKSLSYGYIYDLCVMMRTKHLSPHAMTMIYRSLFEH